MDNDEDLEVSGNVSEKHTEKDDQQHTTQLYLSTPNNVSSPQYWFVRSISTFTKLQ